MLIIGHRFGNTPEEVAKANKVIELDMMETDVWYHGNKFLIRHGRRIFNLPFLVDECRLKSMPSQFTLEDLARLSNTKGLFLDLKTKFVFSKKRFLRDLLRAIHLFPANIPFVVTSRNWRLLELIQKKNPRLNCYFAIRKRRDIPRIKRMIKKGLSVSGVNINYLVFLKEYEAMEFFLKRGILVSAWIVNQFEVAEDLVKMGIGAIISDSTFLLTKLHQEAEIRKSNQ